jgi:hypothetical protein
MNLLRRAYDSQDIMSKNPAYTCVSAYASRQYDQVTRPAA